MDDYVEYLRRLKELERRERWRGLAVPAILLLATVFTTLFAGALMQFLTPADILSHPAKLLRGASFGVPLMVILLTHEMGHFVTSKIHRVKATLPYFIPFPNYIGTFGAVIKMKSPMRDRRALMDIGAAGPLAGFVLSVIACAWGLTHFEIIPISKVPEWGFWNPRIAFGPNLAIVGLYNLFDFHLQPGYLYSSPLFDAGWLGMFVTSLNLLPAGQLDGGHIAYAMLGERGARRLARLVVAILLPLGLLALIWENLWIGWTVWGVLITALGLRHPPPLNAGVQLDPVRKMIGLVSLIVFILTFTPMPFQIF